MKRTIVRLELHPVHREYMRDVPATWTLVNGGAAVLFHPLWLIWTGIVLLTET